MDREFAEKIELFFREPLIASHIPPGYAQTLGVLYVLRRDIQGCLSERKYLIPATMTILAGIDLLGKFYAGDDKGHVGDRFRNFVRDYFKPLASDDEKVIYALRNALLHSFGLYSEGMDFLLVETHSGSDLVVIAPDNTLIIGVNILYERFDQAVSRYFDALRTDESLQQKFTQMFEHYGLIRVGVAGSSSSDPPS